MFVPTGRKQALLETVLRDPAIEPRPRLHPHEARRRQGRARARAGRHRRRRRSTATSRSRSASGRLPPSRTAPAGCWSRPTSPPAASTSTACQPRHQLRPAERAGNLRPPHRPHGPRRGDGPRDLVLQRRGAGLSARHRAADPPEGAGGAVAGGPGCGCRGRVRRAAGAGRRRRRRIPAATRATARRATPSRTRIAARRVAAASRRAARRSGRLAAVPEPGPAPRRRARRRPAARLARPRPAPRLRRPDVADLPACGERVRPSAEPAERSEAGVRGRCRKGRLPSPQRLLRRRPLTLACCAGLLPPAALSPQAGRGDGVPFNPLETQLPRRANPIAPQAGSGEVA